MPDLATALATVGVLNRTDPVLHCDELTETSMLRPVSDTLASPGGDLCKALAKNDHDFPDIYFSAIHQTYYQGCLHLQLALLT